MRRFLVFLVVALAVTTPAVRSPGAEGADSPAASRFLVPGHEREMELLGELLALHQSPRTICTLWDAWVPKSTVWLAVGDVDPTADAMRSFYRRSLSTRQIDPQGYVTMNQHRGLAHPGGWPFPTWQQAGGAGWHFTHAGDGYARMLRTPTATMEGCTLTGVSDQVVDPQAGLRFQTAGEETILTLPECGVDAFVAPFVVVEWSSDRLDADASPWLQWTTEEEPGFADDRRVPFGLDCGLGAQYGGGLKFSTVAVHRHPEWKGKVTRLRIGWRNKSPVAITIRSVYTACDSRHPITGSLFVQGCCDFFDWTTDLDFLRANVDRMRRAIRFTVDEFAVPENGCVLVPWVGHDGRAGFTRSADGKKRLLYGHGVGNNYWDLLPFGHRDCLATIYLFDATRRMAGLERAIEDHPEWEVARPPQGFSAEDLLDLAEHVRQTATRMFWNQDTGRFVACIDADGRGHDYGFTFVNLEAIHYGFATREQARSILDWVDGKRIVAGDTSTGPDVYHWRFGPRATTRRNVEWYVWAWHNPESIPWGGQVQDGGAVLGFSYFDLIARLEILGPDNARRRLSEILDWFEEVQAEGGYRKYYAGPGRGTLQGGGTPGGLGMDHEFMESVLVPQVMLYGFLGFQPRPGGFSLHPRLPADWPSLTVTRIHVQGRVIDVQASRETIVVTSCRADGGALTITLPHGDWIMEGRETVPPRREFDVRVEGRGDSVKFVRKQGSNP